jgi:hypothetical protein
MNTLMILLVPEKAGNFLLARRLVASQEYLCSTEWAVTSLF